MLSVSQSTIPTSKKLIVHILRMRDRNDGDVRNEVGLRLGKSGASFRILNKVWYVHNISISNKLKLFNNIVVSALKCGCESWKGTK